MTWWREHGDFVWIPLLALVLVWLDTTRFTIQWAVQVAGGLTCRRKSMSTPKERAGAEKYTRTTNYPPAIFTYKINSRVDEEMFVALTAQAKRQNTTIGELLRCYIEWGLENDTA